MLNSLEISIPSAIETFLGTSSIKNISDILILNIILSIIANLVISQLLNFSFINTSMDSELSIVYLTNFLA